MPSEMVYMSNYTIANDIPAPGGFDARLDREESTADSSPHEVK